MNTKHRLGVITVGALLASQVYKPREHKPVRLVGESGFRFKRRVSASLRPNPQRYPSGCRRLFRAHKIDPLAASRGTIPEACR